MPSPIQSSYPGLTFVARLIYFGRVDLAFAGRKSANLGELMREGFDVLGGYVVTTSAFDLLLASDDLQMRMRNLLASIKLGDAVSLTDQSRTLHND